MDLRKAHEARCSRILLIEDDASAREALALLLEGDGFEVTGAIDGTSALRVLHSTQPHLVITDLDMPGLDGLGVIAAIREEPETSELPVIVVSSHSETRVRVEGFSRGCDDFVSKPLEYDELLARIRRQLARAQRQKAIVRESLVDALTGVLNRRGILDFVASELKNAVTSAGMLSLVMIDLDYFKAINDRYGHLAGDVALCQVARVLQEEVRVTDRIGRLGGDEFLVVLPGLGEDALQSAMRRLRAALPISVTISDSIELQVELSLGGSHARPEDDVRTLLERADLAMYADKRSRK